MVFLPHALGLGMPKVFTSDTELYKLKAKCIKLYRGETETDMNSIALMQLNTPTSVSGHILLAGFLGKDHLQS